MVGSETARGLLIAPYVRVSGDHHGVSIALLNRTRRLHGMQLGLFNWAGNNSRALRLLPIANVHRGP
jgi:hypothetical protein